MGTSKSMNLRQHEDYELQKRKEAEAAQAEVAHLERTIASLEEQIANPATKPAYRAWCVETAEQNKKLLAKARARAEAEKAAHGKSLENLETARQIESARRR